MLIAYNRCNIFERILLVLTIVCIMYVPIKGYYV